MIHVSCNQRVKWFTDNTGVCTIVQKGSMKVDLQDLAMKIFNLTSMHSIHLEIEWIPRSENARADYLSRVMEIDDWGVATEIIHMIQSRWGSLDVDYFASEHNAKLPVFYTRFWGYKSTGVDAFTYDWGTVFGLFVPPIILVARVIKKMQNCKARGVLVVPEWRSANYWPLLCNVNGDFKQFVQDYMYLPINKRYYTPCKNGSGIFGLDDLKFNMFALYITFKK